MGSQWTVQDREGENASGAFSLVIVLVTGAEPNES